MNKTKIEWTDYTINPIKGKCPVACPYCYARNMYDRFKWSPELRFDPTVFNNLPTKPAKVFVGSTMELFLPECQAWLEKTFDLIKPYKWLTFQFLTKQPQNLIKFSPFPDNCWVGVTATNRNMLYDAHVYLKGIKAKVKYISFEPLLENMEEFVDFLDGINWLIIGAQTKPYKPPKIEWVEEITQAARKVGIPIFMKKNLEPIIENRKLIQEMPK